ncbi:unnamed protein product [Coffea canephora]|uniref:DH200=94 genomic scaffold, scaffold_11577 n=1 Tax=Coffea canephora TaxID=49390 RepID=A0A068VNE2_COFCA|nr:unnamed protein product [Coffea canephora]
MYQVLPAGKTPGGLYFLSNLDQTFPYPVEIVFSYKGKGNGTNKTSAEVLKTELATKVLVEFYPLAGCVATSWDGKMLVRCNGEGVPFVEATCEYEMELLGNINPMNRRELRIVHPLQLSRRVTTFKCGGIVVGVVLNHVLIDGKSFIHFVNSWAEVARGMTLSVLPHLWIDLYYLQGSLQSSILLMMNT